MNIIQKTSLLICISILTVFASAGAYVKWPMIEEWYQSIEWSSPSLEGQPSPIEPPTGVDPFKQEAKLPSYALDLHPSYTINAELLPNQATITGSMSIEFDNPQIKDLYLYNYTYNWYPMKIKSISYQKRSLPFQRRDPVVILKNPAPKEKRTTLEIQFETFVPRGPTRFGVKDDVWTLTHWYPMLGAMDQQKHWYEPTRPIGYGDPYYYHYGDYQVTFTTPANYQWVSSWGKGEAKPLAAGRKQTRFQAKKLLNFSLVGSPFYKIETITFKPNLTVDIASTDSQNIQKIKALAEHVFPIYINLYGSLPYPRVAIAETGRNTVYAMEYANLAIFSRDMHKNNQIDHWLPHEIAHLWWYNSIQTLEPRYGWIDEGLVELSVYQYKKQRYGEAVANNLLNEYRADYEQLKKTYPYGKLAKSLLQFKDYYEFDWTYYSKGALLYNNLREQIGEQAYSAFLKRLLMHYHGMMIGPEHLDQALGQTLRGEVRYFVPNNQRLNKDPFYSLYAEYYIDTVINGMSFYPSMPARKKGDTIYVPLREVMEKVGYRVVWTEEKGVIRLQAGKSEVVLHEKSPAVEVDGKKHRLAKPLLEIKNRAMVPLSFFDEVMKFQVRYDPDGRVVYITVR